MLCLPKLVHNLINHYLVIFNRHQLPEQVVNKIKFYLEPRLFIPLQFWFNRNPRLSLPCVFIPQRAYYQDVEIDIDLPNVDDLIEIN